MNVDLPEIRELIEEWREFRRDMEERMQSGHQVGRLYLSFKEAGVALDVHENTIRNMAKAGELPVVHIRSKPRIPLDAILRLKEKAGGQ